ncbi:MLP-like protein 43 [Senna tora]|uniref:MLP-like protein 43 n=1 Tax=Senna tora TaxID=362788 RepID=A0A834W7K0_9FABA|nr:MLP-like protein 43 [Senna tora]
MALKGKIGAEIEIQSSASKFFNLFATQLHEVQNMTDEVHETKLHKGDWHGVGSHSVKHWTFTSDGKVTTCKENFEEIDEENKSLTFNLFDGDIGEQYKRLKAKLKVIDNEEKGGLAKWTYEYEKTHEAIPPPHSYLNFAIQVSRDVDAHLIKA